MDKDFLMALEAYRAYARILLKTLVDKSEDDFNDTVQKAFFAFGIEDDRLAKLLNQLINGC